MYNNIRALEENVFKRIMEDASDFKVICDEEWWFCCGLLLGYVHNRLQDSKKKIKREEQFIKINKKEDMYEMLLEVMRTKYFKMENPLANVDHVMAAFINFNPQKDKNESLVNEADPFITGYNSEYSWYGTQLSFY